MSTKGTRTKAIEDIRTKAIQIIGAHFPADSPFVDTAAIGTRPLEQARAETGYDWRREPIEVLLRYAELCKEHECREYQKLGQLK